MLSLAGMFDRHRLYAVAGASGMVLGAWYLLTMLQIVFFGPLKEPAHDGHDPPVRDISLRELAAIVPIAAACLWIGVKPQPLIDMIRPDVEAVAALYEIRTLPDEALAAGASPKRLAREDGP
jgi:NADH-quinone oxidoreductase subunit M